MVDAKTKRNPYVIGRPIHEQTLFYGRKRLFSWIEDNLVQGSKVILLHGQRRIGKSSLLRQIPHFVHLEEEFVFCSFDLQDQARLSLPEVLHNLASTIIECLHLSQKQVIAPSKETLEKNPEVFKDDFLPQVYQGINHQNLVLLLDEFDVLSDYTGKEAAEHFFPFLKSLVNQEEKLFIIPVVGRRIDDMPTLLNLFHAAPVEEIGLLDKESATRLITQPAEGMLEYEPEAVEKIYSLAAGHPYFIQILGFTAFGYAREQDKWIITGEDVDNIIDRAIDTAEGGLVWFRDGLPISERVMFSTIAEMQEREFKDSDFRREHPLNFLKDYGVVETDLLKASLGNLEKWGFIELYKTFSYRVKVELVRRWLLKRYPLEEAIWDLEKVVQWVYDSYQREIEKWQKNNPEKSIDYYQYILKYNSNYLSAVFEIAEAYFYIADFKNAVEFYERAYKINSFRCQEEFYRSLLSYGKELILGGKFEIAREQFTQACLLNSEAQVFVSFLNSSELRILDDEIIIKGEILYRSLNYLAYEKKLDNNEYYRFKLTEKYVNFINILKRILNFSEKEIEIFKFQLQGWNRYQEKLETYTQKVLDIAFQKPSISAFSQIRDNLYQLKIELKINEIDAEKIRKQYLPEVEAQFESAKSKYYKEFEKKTNKAATEKSFKNDKILSVIRIKIGLSERETMLIEQQVLDKYNKRQKAIKYYQEFYKNLFDKTKSGELSSTDKEELKELQQLLGLSNKEIKQIEKEVRGDGQTLPTPTPTRNTRNRNNNKPKLS